MDKPEIKATSISLIARHIEYLERVKNQTGISKAETVRRALDMLMGSNQDPLKGAGYEKKENSDS